MTLAAPGLAVIAVVMMVTSITFGSSLNALVSRSALYGWNWDYALLAGFSGAENLPAAETAALLDRPLGGGSLGRGVEAGRAGRARLGQQPRGPGKPALLSGHRLQAPSQVVLGTATLAQLRKHVGGTVVADIGQRSPVRLRIVGTTTLPTIGSSGGSSLQMGTGAIVDAARFPAQALNPQGSPMPGPMAVLITTQARRNPGRGAAVTRPGHRGSQPAFGPRRPGRRRDLRPPPWGERLSGVTGSEASSRAARPS